MRIPQTKQQKIKAGLHFGQAALIFVAGCLALGVMTKDGGFGGETGFYFALCFITIPALVYQVMVPMWTRAWRFANVYAYATIDVLFIVLWFAASVAVGAWNGQGVAKGSKASQNPSKSTRADTTTSTTPSGCDAFAWGSATKCQVSRASVGIGFFITILFAATAFFSFRQVFDYKRTGVMPNGQPGGKSGDSRRRRDVEDLHKDAWSTNVDELDHDQGYNTRTNHSDDRLAFGQDQGEEDSHGLLNSRHHEQHNDPFEDPARPMSYVSTGTAPPAYNDNMHPSALHPGGAYGGPNNRAHFPGGNYDNVGI